MTFEEFKVLYDAVPWEGEFEFFFSDTDKTYMVIKYDDHVSFQRCGAGDGSGEYSYDSLMELFKTESVDGICLEKDWDKITAIVADFFNASYNKDGREHDKGRNTF